jgi:hypothetical protein
VKAAALILAIVLAAASSGEAQRRGGRGGFSIRPASPEDFDGSWQFCRVAFRQNRNGDGGGWSVDFPRADINMSIRLSELSKTTVSFAAEQEPNHIMMTEVGAAYIDEAEAEALRNYLLKGGFLWADDFWGEWAWEAWAEQLDKALPRAQYPPKDLPKDHPLFRTIFDIGGVPQIASIGNWLGTGSTSERGAESAVPHARGVFDQSGRMMALMTHNTDIGDSWEEEASHPQYFYEFSTKGYAFGINAIVYGMTH